MLLEKICRKLGVEVGEEWVGNDGKFYSIGKDGKLTNYAYKEYGKTPYTDCIERVLTGELTPAGQPRKGDVYFTPELSKPDKYSRYTWCNRGIDRLLYNRNLVFKTKEEAIECAVNMIELAKHGI